MLTLADYIFRLMPGPPPKVPLQQLFGTAETLYQRDGFVRWAEVGNIHGISRSSVQLRFKRAIELGELDQATYNRWESSSSRGSIIAKRAGERRHDRNRSRLLIILTPENKDWLEAQCKERSVTSADIVNGLLNIARQRK